MVLWWERDHGKRTLLLVPRKIGTTREIIIRIVYPMGGVAKNHDIIWKLLGMKELWLHLLFIVRVIAHVDIRCSIDWRILHT